MRESSIQAVAEGQEFDKSRCVFRDLPETVLTGIPEEPFGPLVVKKCSEVIPNGCQNPATIFQKWSLASTWLPLRPQILPGDHQERQKVPKVIDFEGFRSAYSRSCRHYVEVLRLPLHMAFRSICGSLLIDSEGFLSAYSRSCRHYLEVLRLPFHLAFRSICGSWQEQCRVDQ